jgi:hypothetical protein
MTENDPFARLEAGLAQPRPAKAAPPDDQQIVETVESAFATLFDAFRKFDTILTRRGGWNARFAWLNVDENRIAYGLLNVFKDGHIVNKLHLSFQGEGVWFDNSDFVAAANRKDKNGNWMSSEISDLIDVLSTYIQQVVQQHE